MYCKTCGKEVNDNAEICPHCGCRLKGVSVKEEDTSNAGWAVLGFFFQLIGLILYLVWKDQYPLRAKSVGKGALIGVIVDVSVSIIYVIIAVCVIGIGTRAYYYY